MSQGKKRGFLHIQRATEIGASGGRRGLGTELQSASWRAPAVGSAVMDQQNPASRCILKSVRQPSCSCPSWLGERPSSPSSSRSKSKSLALSEAFSLLLGSCKAGGGPSFTRECTHDRSGSFIPVGAVAGAAPRKAKDADFLSLFSSSP
ncbi:hypothetical protein C4D60_Mb06t33550 [Musa balbisiana]|uniref:Uncharacterized protein n=1 Tax=Musa balbisiana TaxID=52838 RepID=A0A4S8ISN6_MUSBA|nr:hypothetical protein C4D60_Mb06t33550 [Musa balbisiana]